MTLVRIAQAIALASLASSALAWFMAWIGIAFSTELWMSFVISAIILGFAGAATSELFAAIQDELHAHPTAGGERVVAIVRMPLTAVWVVGPVHGSVIAAQFGTRTMLFATALATLAQVIPLGTLKVSLPKIHHREPVQRSPSVRACGEWSRCWLSQA